MESFTLNLPSFYGIYGYTKQQNTEQKIMKSLKVYYKNVYGNDLIYSGCKDSNTFLSLLGKKTFSKYDLKKIKTLGYAIEFITYNPLGDL